MSMQVRKLELMRREEGGGDFPGGPVAKTLHSHRVESEFNSWSGIEILHALTERSCMLQWKSKVSHAETKPWHCQLNK